MSLFEWLFRPSESTKLRQRQDQRAAASAKLSYAAALLSSSATEDMEKMKLLYELMNEQ